MNFEFYLNNINQTSYLLSPNFTIGHNLWHNWFNVCGEMFGNPKWWLYRTALPQWAAVCACRLDWPPEIKRFKIISERINLNKFNIALAMEHLNCLHLYRWWDSTNLRINFRDRRKGCSFCVCVCVCDGEDLCHILPHWNEMIKRANTFYRNLFPSHTFSHCLQFEYAGSCEKPEIICQKLIFATLERHR